MITTAQLAKFAPKLNATQVQQLCDAINPVLVLRGINTARRIRYFMAQTYFETQGYTKWDEDLYYTTPQRLVAVWPFRFTMNQADTTKAYAPDYVRNEQKLANLVYAGREGNGGPATGDGFNFRGQGGIHLTFRNNFAACSKSLYGDDRLLTNPASIQDYVTGMQAAGWFWGTNNINALADADQFTQATYVINKSRETAPQRLLVLNVANTIFTGPVPGQTTIGN